MKTYENKEYDRPLGLLADPDVADWVDWHCGAEIDANVGAPHVQAYYREDCIRDHWPAASVTKEGFSGHVLLQATVGQA